MDEAFYVALGFAMIYTLVHFYVIQFTKTWSERNTFDKALTIMAAVFLTAVFIGM